MSAIDTEKPWQAAQTLQDTRKQIDAVQASSTPQSKQQAGSPSQSLPRSDGYRSREGDEPHDPTGRPESPQTQHHTAEEPRNYVEPQTVRTADPTVTPWPVVRCADRRPCRSRDGRVDDQGPRRPSVRPLLMPFGITRRPAITQEQQPMTDPVSTLAAADAPNSATAAVPQQAFSLGDTAAAVGNFIADNWPILTLVAVLGVVIGVIVLARRVLGANAEQYQREAAHPSRRPREPDARQATRRQPGTRQASAVVRQRWRGTKGRCVDERSAARPAPCRAQPMAGPGLEQS